MERDAGVRSAVCHGALLCPIPLAGAPRAAVPGATTMPRSPAPPAPHFAQTRWAGAFLAPGIVVFGITWGEAPCEPPLKLRFRSACRYSRYRLHLASRHASRKAAVRPRSAEQGPLWGCDRRRARCSAPSYSSWSLARLHGHTFRGSTLRRAPIVDLFRGSSGGLPLQWRLLPAATAAGACDGGHLAATDRHS